MASNVENALWGFMFALSGTMAQMIQYPFLSTCAVTGSTATLPCSFTPKTSFHDGIKQIPLKIVRVRWCKNHAVCQKPTPSVFDSNSENKESRFQYLGDLKGICTLQIRNITMEDNATFRFRMEADESQGHFTNMTGVNITVVDSIKMRIKSSRNDSEFSRGQTVSLQCTTSTCTFNHLEVTWLRDGHALSGNGSALWLSALTAKDSGNYTCALKRSMRTQSEPFTLQVEAEEEASGLPLIAGVVFGVLLVVTTLILVLFISKRKRTAAEHPAASGGETEMKTDDVYSTVQTGSRTEEVGHEGEEVSYSQVQFKHNNQNRKAEVEADPTIYSSVATRG